MGDRQGYEFEFLDVGGGFEAASFEEMSMVLSQSLDEWFPREEGVRIVAERGRVMVSSGECGGGCGGGGEGEGAESVPSVRVFLMLSFWVVSSRSIHISYIDHRSSSRTHVVDCYRGCRSDWAYRTTGCGRGCERQ